MHPSKCLSFEADADFHSCVKGWFGRTTTDFYGSTELSLPWWFGLCCFSYTARALFEWFVSPKWPKRVGFPLLLATLTVTIQGPISFMADYVYMTESSLIHVVDRCFAIPNFFTEIAKIYFSYRFVRTETFLIHVIGLFCASFAFYMSSEAQSNVDANGFIFWHNTWHLIPLVTIGLNIYECIIRGELDIPSNSKKSADTKPPLLSSVVMNKSNNSLEKHQNGNTITTVRRRKQTRKE